MLATLGDTTNEMDGRATLMRDAWVIRMVQFGAVPILIFSILNVVEFYGPRWSWALGSAWLSVLLSVICISLTFTRWFTRHWRATVLFFLVALTASDAMLAALGHQESKLFVFSVVLMMVGTGSILPWSTRYQVSFNLLCLVSYAVRTLRVPILDGNEAYEIIGMITAAAISWFSCHTRDRFVRRHEESECISRESEGALRQIFDANTEGITLIDETIQRVETDGDLSYMPELLRVKGGLFLSIPQPSVDDAEMYLMQSLEWSRRQCARGWELRTAVDLAALLADQGRPERGRALLQPVFEQFVEGSDTADLKAAERLLATLG